MYTGTHIALSTVITYRSGLNRNCTTQSTQKVRCTLGPPSLRSQQESHHSIHTKVRCTLGPPKRSGLNGNCTTQSTQKVDVHWDHLTQVSTGIAPLNPHKVDVHWDHLYFPWLSPCSGPQWGIALHTKVRCTLGPPVSPVLPQLNRCFLKN